MVAISHRLLIDGEQFDANLLAAVQQIEAEDHKHLASMLRLRLSTAVSPQGDSWQYIDDDIFSELVPLELRVSIESRAEETILRAHVISANTIFSNQPGESGLEVVAMDPTVLMNLEQKIRAWPDMSDSDIATAIFQEYGIQPHVDRTQPARDEVRQSCIQRATDIVFLKSLARRNGFDCYVEPNSQNGQLEGHFHPPRLELSPEGVLCVNMHERTNVRSFRTYYDMLRPTACLGYGMVGHEAEEIKIEGSSWQSMGKSPPEKKSNRQMLFNPAGMSDPAELETAIQSEVNRAEWAVSAEGELSASAYNGILRAGRTVLVRGVGKNFSGKYFVEKVLHIINQEGYIQRFLLRRNALGVAGDEDFSDT